MLETHKLQQQGFTLPELMTVLAVLAILAMVVVPGLSGFIHSNQATAAANNLLNQLQLTRSEAVKRSALVTLCHSSNQETCTEDSAWAGYLLIRSADQVVSVVELAPSTSITATPAIKNVGFNSVGAATQAVTFLVQREDKCFDVELQLNGRADVRRRSCPNV